MGGATVANSEELPLICGACRARIDGLCEDCAPKVQRVIANYRTDVRAIKAGDHLFRPAEPCDLIYSLVEGWVFLYSLLDNGRRQILHFALPGALLGFYPHQTPIYGAQALTDAVVCAIPHESLGSLFQQHPGVGLRLAWIVWRERNLAYDHLSSIARQSARERVARLLMHLILRYRLQRPDHYYFEEIHLPLTQEQIGDATGLTGVHVNRVLQGLRKDGIVAFHYRRLRILNLDKLIDVAAISPQTIV